MTEKERIEYDLILKNFWLKFVKSGRENSGEEETEDGVSL